MKPANPSPPSAPAPRARLDLWLAAVVILSGACLMAFEIVGSRIIAPSYGSSIYTWGSLIGIVMFALSAGYFLGGKLADWKPSYLTLAIVLGLSGGYIVLVPFFSLEVCNGFIPFGQKWGSFLSCLILFVPSSLLMGMVSPMAIKLQASTIESVGKVAGTLYALSTFGSIAGTFLSSFVLLTEMGMYDLTKAIGFVLLATALLCLAVAFLRRGVSPGMGIASLFLVTLGLCGGVVSAMVPSPLTFETEYGYKLVATEDSEYNTLYVIDYTSQGQRLLQFNNRRESGFYLDEPNRSSFSYTSAIHAVFGANRDIKDVLLIGGGGAVLPIEFVCAYPWTTFDSVEIDPGVMKYSKEYFMDYAIDYFSKPKYLADESTKDWANLIRNNIRLIEADGRLYVKDCEKKYDLIIMDAYLGGRIPHHLTTIEFFTDLTACLKDDGVLAMNIISSFWGDKGLVFRSLYRTIDSLCPSPVIVPMSGYPGIEATLNKDGDSPGNIILIATRKGNLTGKSLKASVDMLAANRFFPSFIRGNVQSFCNGAGTAAEYEALDRTYTSGNASLVFKPLIDPDRDVILTDDYCPIDIWSGYTIR